MPLEENRASPAPWAFVWWILWFSILAGFLIIYAKLGRHAAIAAPAGDNAVVAGVAILALVASSFLRWFVLPKVTERQRAFILLVIGLTLAEGCGILGVFLVRGQVDEFAALSVVDILQWAPLFAQRFAVVTTSGRHRLSIDEAADFAPFEMHAALAAAFCFAAAAGLRGAELRESDDARAQRIVASAPFKAAVAAFERDFDRFVNEIVTLTEIPAPPFGEQARGEAFAKLLRDAGLERVETDAEGNVLGLRRGRGTGPLLAVAAHLDTVFPAGTDVKVKRVGTTLRAPGVGDDTRGLAFLLAFIRALREAKVETASDILFVGDVGEEGPGDLRGVRHLFTRGPWKDQIKRFISVDGGNLDLVTNSALGSLRYKVTFQGPGGHSWAAFGIVNPAFAMGDAIARLGQLKVSKNPKVTYNVGVVSGGTSVNSIPFETAMEIDMRAVSPAALKEIDAQFRKIVADAVKAENVARSTVSGRITADIKLIGDRPSGTTPPDSPALRQVAATMRVYDKVPVWETGSTDANLPISLGIPAFAIGRQSGGMSGRGHSLDEWTDVEKTQAVKDFSLSAALILSVAELP